LAVSTASEMFRALNPFARCSAEPVDDARVFSRRSEQVFHEECASFRVRAPTKNLEMLINIHQETKRIELYFFNQNADAKKQFDEERSKKVAEWVRYQVMIQCARSDLNVSQQQDMCMQANSYLVFAMIVHVTMPQKPNDASAFDSIVKTKIVPNLRDAFNMEFVMETPVTPPKPKPNESSCTEELAAASNSYSTVESSSQ